MRGIIIAAGMGKRMKELTNSKPKCLLQIGGKSLLEWTIEGMKYAGCNEIFVITGYKGNQIKKLGYSTIENKEYKSNNILQSFFKAKKIINNDILVAYSDIYVEKEIFKQLAEYNKDLILTIDKSWQSYYKNRTLHPVEQAEKATLDKNFKVEEIGKDITISKNKKYYEFIGLFKVSKNATKVINKTYSLINNKINLQDGFERSDSWKNAYITDFFQFIINNQILEINAHIISKGWAEFDTMEDYFRVNDIKKTQKLISIK